MGALAAVGAFVGFSSSVHAAADTGLATAIASGTEVVSDNAPQTMSFIGTMWGKALLIGILISVLTLATVMIRGAIIRRRGRR